MPGEKKTDLPRREYRLWRKEREPNGHVELLPFCLQVPTAVGLRRRIAGMNSRVVNVLETVHVRDLGVTSNLRLLVAGVWVGLFEAGVLIPARQSQEQRP